MDKMVNGSLKASLLETTNVDPIRTPKHLMQPMVALWPRIVRIVQAMSATLQVKRLAC